MKKQTANEADFRVIQNSPRETTVRYLKGHTLAGIVKESRRPIWIHKDLDLNEYRFDSLDKAVESVKAYLKKGGGVSTK